MNELFLTGGSSDVALEFLRSLPPGPQRVLVHYRRSLDKILALKAERPDLDLVTLPADLSRADQVAALIAAARAAGASPDRIVHFAAPKARSLYFRQCRWEDFELELDVQLRSIALLLREFLPDMTRRGKGRVVFVLSSYTREAPPQGMSPYVTAKHALLGLMKSLSVEYARHGVTVNAVSPALMMTSFLEELPPRMVELLGQEARLSPREVAPVLLTLLSDTSGSITGTNIPIPA
ncbi:MAG: SDR family oxidoreductase [Elusimicrobiota bacterium]